MYLKIIKKISKNGLSGDPQNRWIHFIDPFRGLGSLQNLSQLQDHAVDLYVDNTAAEAILRKGASSSDDLNSFAAQFWATALQMNLSVRVFRVPSKLNTADEASRFLSQGKAPPLASRFLRSRQLKVIKTLARYSVFSITPDCSHN